MKKTSFIILAIVSLSMTSCKEKEILEKLNKIEHSMNSNLSKEPIYKIYPTKNMWNFLKLDTRNGKVSIVQFSVEDDNKQFEYSLSDQVQVENKVPGRFVLQPTDNIYNFIMLDQVTGQTYQVQWSFDEDKRFIVPINK